MRLFAIAAVVPALLFGVPGALAPANSGAPLLAISHRDVPEQQQELTLEQVDPLSLVRVGPALPLGGTSYAEDWAFSPDRSKLALGSTSSGTIRIVDLGAMKIVREVSVGLASRVRVLSWPAPNRLLALATGVTEDFVVADPETEKLHSRRHLPGDLLYLARAGEGVAFLFSPTVRISAARLVIGSPNGRIRSVRLRKIVAGQRLARGGVDYVREPAVAVDSAARHAYVVGAPGPIADVDLRTMKPTYHYLLELAKNFWGSRRSAWWLDDGRMAVSGITFLGSHVGAPAGLKLVDVGTWASSTLDPTASWFQPTSSLLLTYGGEGAWNELRGYSFAGRRMVRARFNPSLESLDVARDYVYSWGPEEKSTRIVDLADGSVLAKVPSPDYLQMIDKDWIDQP
ncbi:MAG: hypothetical protein M3R70_13270 [Actinomycetota bacterium]|nr:hypothetical protein [Actinomycetota bacterium]